MYRIAKYTDKWFDKYYPKYAKEVITDGYESYEEVYPYYVELDRGLTASQAMHIEYKIERY